MNYKCKDIDGEEFVINVADGISPKEVENDYATIVLYEC